MKTENQKLYTKVDNLRFRKTPYSKNLNNLIRELKNGQKLELLDGPWLKVRVGRKEGWVHGGYVTEAEPIIKKQVKSKREIAFIKGVPNLKNDIVTITVRKAINDLFNLGKSKEDYPLNCTEYVQYRVKEKLGLDIEWPVKWGRDRGKWAAIFKKYNKYRVLTQPKVNCAMCFTSGISKKPKINAIGHVAFIEKVYPNGTISISEVNMPNSGIYNERPIPKKKWQKQYKAQFVEFV